MLVFDDTNHSYTSLDLEHDVPWISVTSLVSFFKTPFDAPSAARKASVNPRSKWYGYEPEDLIKIWDSEAKRSTDAGKWYHSLKEEQVLSKGTIIENGAELLVQAPLIKEGLKYAPNQKLNNNTVYPEHLVYSYSDQICGQSDKVDVKDFKVNITDYKTNKEIKTSSFVNWEGISQKMLHPVSHLEDCHLIHYTLQMSLYMYMILKHNPKLSPGDLLIEHIKFKLEGTDKHGYPIYLKDDKGQFIVEDIVPYRVPYLKGEVQHLLQYVKENRDKLLSLKKK